jgi:hypothetical protein
MGRPSKYNAKFAEFVLDAMVVDGSTAAEACRQIGLKRGTFNGWVRDDRDGLAARYMRAQRIQVYCMHDDMLEIVDSSAGSSAQIKRRLNRLRARCERIEAKHAKIAAAARDAQIAAWVRGHDVP